MVYSTDDDPLKVEQDDHVILLPGVMFFVEAKAECEKRNHERMHDERQMEMGL